jgi:hypothetical protein
VEGLEMLILSYRYNFWQDFKDLIDGNGTVLLDKCETDEMIEEWNGYKIAGLEYKVRRA